MKQERKRKNVRLSDQIRLAIRECGIRPYSLAKECGFSRWVLYRFLRGEGGMTTENIDILAQRLGLELTPKDKAASA